MIISRGIEVGEVGGIGLVAHDVDFTERRAR